MNSNDFTFVSFNDNLIEVVKLTTGVCYTLGNRIDYIVISGVLFQRILESAKINGGFNRFSVCIFAAQ